MPDPAPLLLVAIAATFFGAGLVKGVTGMGLPTVAMGVLGALISPLAAAALLLIPSLVTNIGQGLTGPGLGALLRRLWPMLLAIALGTGLGSAMLTGGDPRLTTRALGAALVAYALFTLCVSQLRVPARAEPVLSPLAGAATGVVSGATGVFVIPAVPYLQALGLARDDLVQALGLSFTVSTLALGAGLAWHGALRADQLALSALAVVPALAGMWCGQRIRARVSPGMFRRGFLVCLLLLGAEMLARGLL